jgi:hypothetical protein
MARPTKHRIGSGVLSANECYTTDDLHKRGYGREVLIQARKSGIVTARTVGNNIVYFGSELLDYFKTLPEASFRNPHGSRGKQEPSQRVAG